MATPPVPKNLDLSDPKTKNFFMALANPNPSGVTAGTYSINGSPIFTVSAQGFLTNAISQTVTAVPSGNASGDLTGTYPNPSVIKVNGLSLTSLNATNVAALLALSGTNTGDQTSVSGNAGTVTNGVYTTDTGTVTNTMLAGSIANNKLTNSSITINGVSTSLGGSTSITDATLSTSDVTTNDVSTSKHGFAPKAPNDATKYLDGTGAYTVPTAVMPAGSILQVLQAQVTTPVTISGATMTDATGVTQAITPASSSNKILVRAVLQVGNPVTDAAEFRLVRGSTAIGVGTSVSSRDSIGAQLYGTVAGLASGTVTLEWLDSPSTTSSTTYKVQGSATGGGSVYLNRSATDTDGVGFPRMASTLTLMEVKG